MINTIYSNLCPICGKDLSIKEILKNKCINKNKELYKYIDINEFKKFFSVIGKLNSIQEFWTKRLLSNESFSLIAPTGIGKTTWVLMISLFMARKGKKSYILLPTTILIDELESRAKHFSDNLRIIAYHSKKDKAILEKIKSNDFDILITTPQFLSRNYKLIKNLSFNYIFIDDIDAFLKNSRNLNKIVYLAKRSKSQLIISTATAKKGRGVTILRKEFGLDVAINRQKLRDIVDTYIEMNSLNELINLLKKLGPGGIIYTEKPEKIYKELSKHLKIGLITSRSKKDYEAFKNGEIDYLIGTITHYGLLVRGLDLPFRVRYTVFFGIPKREIDLSIDSSILEKWNISDKDKDLLIRNNKLIIPDISTYLQASGRSSRLTIYGLTKGLSIVIEKDKELLNTFIERARIYGLSIENLKDLDIDKLVREIDKSRKKGKKIDIIPTLLLVESPTKAKQIARFYGYPGIKIYGNVIVYEVLTKDKLLLITATLGHITDLSINNGFHGVIVEKNNFIPIYSSIKKCSSCGFTTTLEINKCPRCGKELMDSKERIGVYQYLSRLVNQVIIATDPDTEGEKIAFDVKNLLFHPQTNRALFHEITKQEIDNQLKNLASINENLVAAQIVRRIEDRWIGFELTQLLWSKFRDKNLSAGRAQTPVLGWVINRYRESKKKQLVAKLMDILINNEEIVKKLSDKEIVNVELIDEKEELVNPLPPFNTNDLLREASRFMSVKEVMQIAQELFENGLITYHRTDSYRISDKGLEIAKELLRENFYPRRWGKQSTHEAIRITKPLTPEELEKRIKQGIIVFQNFSSKHLQLYRLIFNRFIASQTPPIKVYKKVYRINIKGYELIDERIVNAEGIALSYVNFIPIKKELREGEYLVKIIKERRQLVKPFTQGELVKEMKDKGIGRPSTYSTIIDKLFKRRYILEKNHYLISTLRGEKVYSFLSSNYYSFISEDRTRELEEKMKLIEEGKTDYLKELREVFKEIESIRALGGI